MCKECGMAYSFVFGIQFHKADCSQGQGGVIPLLLIKGDLWRLVA